jgi:MoaA/NifB/PqqE/SkfB family radical SAM enzyme
LENNKAFLRFYDSNNILSGTLQALRRRKNPWLTAYKKHIKKGGNPPYLETLILMLTKRCNLKCDFCDIHDLTAEMKKEDALKVIDNGIRAGVTSLIITGGEPFLHKDLFDVTKYATERGLDTCITTNGSMITDNIEEIISSGVNTLSVSLDGFGEVHDEIRHRKGLFENVKRGIEELRKTECSVALNFVLTKRNISDLEKLYAWSKERNIFFDFWPVNYCRDLYINQNGDFARLLKFTKSLKRNVEIRRAKYYFFKKIPLYLRKDISLRMRCLGLSRYIGVDVNGDIMPCCVWGKDKANLGNAIRDDIRLLWNSKRYGEVRRAIFYKGCSEGCYNHSLHEFMTITGHNFIVKAQKKRT